MYYVLKLKAEVSRVARLNACPSILLYATTGHRPSCATTFPHARSTKPEYIKTKKNFLICLTNGLRLRAIHVNQVYLML